METYEREAAGKIRAAEVRLAPLSDRALVELWGVYSCKKHHRFWVPCDAKEIFAFLEWSKPRKSITRLVARAQTENEIRAENRALARSVRPRPRFVAGWDGQMVVDPRLRESSFQPAKPGRMSNKGLATVYELVDSVNRWCGERGIVPTGHRVKPLVDVAMVRYCCRYNLMDRPGSVVGKSSRGFTEKHFVQLRLIRLLQARSLPVADINVVLHGRSFVELRGLERDELSRLEARLDGSSPDRRRTGADDDSLRGESRIDGPGGFTMA